MRLDEKISQHYQGGYYKSILKFTNYSVFFLLFSRPNYNIIKQMLTHTLSHYRYQARYTRRT